MLFCSSFPADIQSNSICYRAALQVQYVIYLSVSSSVISRRHVRTAEHRPIVELSYQWRFWEKYWAAWRAPQYLGGNNG